MSTQDQPKAKKKSVNMHAFIQNETFKRRRDQLSDFGHGKQNYTYPERSYPSICPVSGRDSLECCSSAAKVVKQQLWRPELLGVLLFPLALLSVGC